MPEGLAPAIVSIGSFLLVCAFLFDRWLYRRQVEMRERLARIERDHSDRVRKERAVIIND